MRSGLRSSRRIPGCLLLAGLWAMGCSRSSSAAISPSATPAGAPAISGQIINGVTGQPVPGAAIRIDGLGDTTGAADGSFTLASSGAGASLRAVNVSSPATIERSTWAVVPGTALTLSLMPSTIDLTAFNQMFRGNNGELHRWPSAPAVVLQRRALRFTTLTDSAYTAIAAVMPDAEAEAILTDLGWALPQLSGSVFPAFSNVQRETAAEGDSIAIARPGIVLVALADGLTASTGFAGYTRWAWNGAGDVVSAIIVIDRVFDSSASPFRRTVRAHELGHALGYNHVTAIASVMNSTATIEPNTFDLDGARIAFQRPVLNRSPDADPRPAFGTTARSSALTWSGAP
ncbi:MAG: hypothetical protein ABI634_00160 [Acidobacteriota bacterium]